MPQGAIPFPFGKCLVCGAQATGKHYGANTCEGCKGFFKRSLPKFGKYKCLNNDKCSIDPENRIKCKLCRFNRCLELGMSMDAIKMGRIPKVQRQKALEENRSEAKQTASDAAVNEEVIGPPPLKLLKTCNNRVSAGSHCSPVHSQRQFQEVLQGGRERHIAEAYHCNPGYNMASSQQNNYEMGQVLEEIMAMNESIEMAPPTLSILPTISDSSTSIHNMMPALPALKSSYADLDWYSMASSKHLQPLQPVDPGDPVYSSGSYLVHKMNYGAKYPDKHKLAGNRHDLCLSTLNTYQSPAVQTCQSNTLSYGSNTKDSSEFHSHSPSVTAASRCKGSSSQCNSQNSTQLLNTQNVNSLDTTPSSNQLLYEDIPPPHHYNPNFHDIHSDYGSSDDVRNEFESFDRLRNSEQTLNNLVKSVAKVYWDVTSNVRRGVNIMEEMIATGSTDRMIPLRQENLSTVWKYLMESVGVYNDLMLKFCLKCPLLKKVSAEDTKILIQHSYLPLWLIWNSPLFKNGQTYLPFCNEYVYTREWMEKILPPDFVTYLYEYTRRQNAARFSINETAVLCGVALTVDNVPGLKDPAAISHIHQQFKVALAHEISSTRLNSKEMLSEVPQLLTHLETAVAKQNIILSFNDQNPPDISFD